MHRLTVAVRVQEDDSGLRLSILRILSDHLRDQDGDHAHVDSACTGNVENLQRHGAAVPPDNRLEAPSLKTHTFRARSTGGSEPGG